MDKYFDIKEYLPGDLAFYASSVIVPPVKKTTIPTLVKIVNTSIQSWRKSE